MMANNQDARPFVDLRNDAEEFQTKFNEDIKECISFLDSKITALMCDPDSLGDSVRNVKQNALLEFSKAKYDIFISVKSLINRKEREWLDYISAMKKLFVENVEIFLAGTKLEVKLPSSEYQSSSGSRKSPGNRKSVSSATSSGLKNIAKSILPVFNPIYSSETSSKDVSDTKHDVQSSRSGRLSAKFNIAPGTTATISLNESMESSDNSDESRTVEEKVQFNRGKRISVKLDNSPRVSSSLDQKHNTESSESSDTETKTVENVHLKRRGRQPTTSIKLSNMQTHTLEENDSEMDTNEFNQRKSAVSRKPARGRKSVRVVEETHDLGSSYKGSNLTSSDEHPEQQHIDGQLPPVSRTTKASSRRKTLLPNLRDESVSDIIPGISARAASKRKTISGVLELESAAPPKRSKVSNKKNVSSIQEDSAANDNLLESDDNYSEWMALKSVDGKIPSVPAVYEVKVWRAKKTAYIGSCDSLRQKLTLYKLRQTTGHKHLDKFVDRNFDDIQVRFEIMDSVEEAKSEVTHRVKRFLEQYKTTPAYN